MHTTHCSTGTSVNVLFTLSEHWNTYQLFIQYRCWIELSE